MPDSIAPKPPALLPRIIVTVLLLTLAMGLWMITRPQRDALVVYCAHDEVFSRPILDAFEQETGIAVEVRFDTEATKSLGLIEQIVRERNRPRCDVFWNNEQLGAMRLAREGLLEEYRPAGWEAIPESCKDPQGRWTGFAARMRVWILHTPSVEPTQPAIDALTRAQDLSRIAIAKPLFGTTRTHYTVQWHAWGGDRLQQWHRSLHDRGIVETSGNAMVKNLVAAGTCIAGLTDTDDYFVAVDAGQPVTALPFLLPPDDTTDPAASPHAIVIPNTVAIIRGTKRLTQAQRLVDYLTSPAVELRLSQSASRQIPLGRVDESALSEEVRTLRKWVANPYPLGVLDEADQACLQWLRQEYLR